MLSAWTLVRVVDRVKSKGIRPALVVLPFFLYLSLFVFDGEKVFIKEPRNEAAEWLLQNVTPGTDISWVYHGEDLIPGYKHVHFPNRGRPTVLIMEMHEANHFLSGLGLKNSYPKDHRYVFDCVSPEKLKAFQALFKGNSEYKEVARFEEGYFMPEYLMVNSLLGNRSRNYVTEIVIFRKNQKRYS
jgi:hypothetical protein